MSDDDNKVKNFDSQVKAFVEYENKTQRIMIDLQEKINRLNKTLQLKKNFLIDSGINKHKISKDAINRKLSLAKTNFDKNIQKARVEINTNIEESRDIKCQQHIQVRLELKPMVALNSSINENEEDDDKILSQIDLSKYGSGIVKV